MASASPRKAFISQKLTFLRGRADVLIDSVGQYVSGIVADGESWIEGGDNRVEYLELCQLIDTASVTMWEKFEQLTGTTVVITSNQLSCGQCETTSQSTPEAAYRQPATQSSRYHREPIQPADDTQLTSILARIAAIEEALCSSRGNAEEVAEQQNNNDLLLKELLSKLSESDKKNNSKFRKVKKQISEISDTQVTLDQEHQARLHRLEKKLKELSTSQDKLKVEMESHAEITETLVHVPNQLESVKENLDVLDARIGIIIDDCSNMNQDIVNARHDLADTVMANTEAIRVISENEDQKMKKVETRLQTLEADTGRHVKDFQKQVERAETNLAQVIQEVSLISPILQELELKTSRTACGFTAEASTMDVTGGMIKPYVTEYCNIGGNFDAASGIFTAPVDGIYVASISLCLYEHQQLLFGVKYTIKEVGKSVGKYKTQHLMYKKQGLVQDTGTIVCYSSVFVANTTSCCVGVVDMKAGDTLFSYVEYNNNNRPFSGSSMSFGMFNNNSFGGSSNQPGVNFSCFLLA